MRGDFVNCADSMPGILSYFVLHKPEAMWRELSIRRTAFDIGHSDRARADIRAALRA